MTMQVFCPIQLQIVEYGFDNADALKRDYAILKNEYSLSGLHYLVEQLGIELNKQYTDLHWNIAYQSCHTGPQGEVYYSAVDINGRPLVVATANARGDVWQPYVMREYAQPLALYVDWQHPNND